MRVIQARNVQQALVEGLKLLRDAGEKRSSRNGDVLVVPGPVTTRYMRPQERVIFWHSRDANPFFHFFESLWMLAGRDDLEYVKKLVKRMEIYSDDGKTLWGAYGKRWRDHFTIGMQPSASDQLSVIIRRLKEDPDDRRCVLQMWDAYCDLDRVGKDVPCNTQAYFWRNSAGRLDMTVCCRSNDMIWGGYGANAVHFSMLQEFMARAIGCEIGNYWQMSNNFHVYMDVFKPLYENLLERETEDQDDNPYMTGVVKPYSHLMTINPTVWLEDCEHFCNSPSATFREPFFDEVARPLWEAYRVHKFKDYEAALRILETCEARDWRLAAQDWIKRRQQIHKKAKDDGPTYE